MFFIILLSFNVFLSKTFKNYLKIQIYKVNCFLILFLIPLKNGKKFVKQIFLMPFYPRFPVASIMYPVYCIVYQGNCILCSVS